MLDNNIENKIEKPEITEDEKEAGDLKMLKMWFDMDKTKGSHEIAKYLVNYFHVKTIGEREREIYIYENGVYKLGINFLKKWLQELLDKDCKTHVKNEILEKVKDLSTTNRSQFYVDKNFINLNNGILDINTLELLPHDPKYLFFKKIPVDYLPEVDCPQIKKFLREILDQETINTIQEFIGFGLYRIYFIKKALILVGEPNTGKTTFLNVINKFFGEENVSGVSLQKITSDKFSAAHLYHKHINTYDDLSFRDINDTGAFKIVTGGGYITAEYKFGNQFQFENYAKLIFACNKIPDVKETDDEAYFGRWIVARFNKEIEKIDNFLLHKLTTQEELSGLLNFSLQGLKRLLKEQVFSYQKDPDEVKNEMMESGSSLASFVSKCLENDPENWISKEDLYLSFRKYGLENNLTVITITNFGRKISNYAPYIIDGKKLIGNKQITGWRNVKIKNSEISNLKKEKELSIDSTLFKNL